MFLEALVNNAHNSIFRYPDVPTYLASRGVTESDVKKYRLGYSKIISVPEDNDPERKGFMEESWKGKKFESKIIFPFQDSLGRVVGMLGRSLESSRNFKNFVTQEGKFMGFFFGLYQALPEIYHTGKAFVVEGPFDAMAFAKVFPNTVGSLTADLSQAQYEFLKFYADEIYLCMDSDKAGRNAVKRVQEKWPEVRSFELGFKDPNHCLERLSLKGFKEHVNRIVNETGSGWLKSTF